MQKNIDQNYSDKLNICTKATYAILCIFIVVRLYLYLSNEELFRDEAALIMALYKGTWLDVVQCKLLFHQACPIFFAVLGKSLLYFSLNQYLLYLFPVCAGIGLAIIFMLLTEKIDGKLYSLICISILCSLKIILYYSLEFKQYIFETFVSASFIYIYI